MALTKITGKALTGSFNGIDLSSASRKFSYKGKAKEIDLSTRDDLVAGERQYEADVPEYEFEWSGLDTTGTHAAIATIKIGDIGPMTVNNSQKSFTTTCTITEQEYDSEQDKGAEWKLKGRMRGKPAWA